MSNAIILTLFPELCHWVTGAAETLLFQILSLLLYLVIGMNTSDPEHGTQSMNDSLVLHSPRHLVCVLLFFLGSKRNWGELQHDLTSMTENTHFEWGLRVSACTPKEF